jgi:hypothetical protein
MRIGLLWCSFFHRNGSEPWFSRLHEAYRPPNLFASKMRAAGHEVEFLNCDEELTLADVTPAAVDNVDMLYVMSHGTFGASGYSVMLEAADWFPTIAGLGDKRLSVVVFDTCEMIKGGQNWQQPWAGKIGKSVKLLLGFDGLAAIDRASSLRGKAFADNLLNGDTFAAAWTSAVRATTISQFSKAVAIGVGDTAADAQAVINGATLNAMPTPRQTANLQLYLAP